MREGDPVTSQGWDPYDHSFMPVLDRALGRILRRWSEVVTQGGNLADCFDSEPGSLATKEFLEQIYSEVQGDRDGRQVSPEGEMLHVRRNQIDRAAWRVDVEGSKEYLDDVGKYLRNAFQYLIQSPTVVPKLEPAREVAILGAGASLHAKLPTTKELFEEIKKALRERDATIEEDLQGAGFEWAWRGDNIEDLLSALQARAWTSRAYQGPSPDEERWIKEILCAYRDVILKWQRGWRETHEKDQITASFLKDLTKCSDTHADHPGASRRWAVISFNQDTVVELEARSQGWKWQDGYGFIPSRLDMDLHSEIGDFRIYKPHGTIAWYRDHETRSELGACQIREDVLSPASLQAIDPARRAQPAGAAPLIPIPSFFKNYGDKVVRDTVAKVCYELYEARHVRAVGFRLRSDDTFVSNLNRFSLRNNTQAKVAPCLLELIGPDSRCSRRDKMGGAWKDVLMDLEQKGWEVNTYPMRFCSYVNGESCNTSWGSADHDSAVHQE